jgi:hypothetical protein
VPDGVQCHPAQEGTGDNPTRFMQMVREIDGVEAARRLLGGPIASDGFTTLGEHLARDYGIERRLVMPSSGGAAHKCTEG